MIGCSALYGHPPIQLGMSAAFSGPSGRIGIKLLEGASLYFDQLNAEGGIHGQSIRIRSYDDGYDPPKTVYNTLKLLQRDQVSILFQYVGTPTTTLMLPLLNTTDKNTLLMFPFTGSETMRQMPYKEKIFNFRASNTQETRTLVDFFVGEKKTKIAIVYQADAFGRSGWSGVRKALQRHNLKLVSEATYQRGFSFNESMAAQIDILKRGNPDAVIIVGAYAATAAFIRDVRESQWAIPMGTISFVGIESVIDLLDNNPSNVKKILDDIYITQVVPYYKDTSSTVANEYMSLSKKHNKTPNYVGFEGYINAKILAQLLLKTTAPFSSDKLISLLKKNHVVDIGLPEPFSLGGQEHQCSNRIHLIKISRGNIVPIQDVQL